MKTRIVLVLRFVAAIILLQTLFFKFTGAEESKYIFTALGAEPWGRIGSGVVELVASILLIVPATQIIGAFLGMGVMVGAIFSHLFVLGIVVQDDGGLLFALACTTFISCGLILVLQREKFCSLMAKFLKIKKCSPST